MYIETVPNRNSPPTVLLRESRRDGEKIIKRTLANLSDWPEQKVAALRAVLKGDYQRITSEPASRISAEDGLPLHSFKTLLAELATHTRNHCRFQSDRADQLIQVLSQLTPLQRRVFELLGICT